MAALVFTTSGRERLADEVGDDPRNHCVTFSFNDLDQSRANSSDKNKGFKSVASTCSTHFEVPNAKHLRRRKSMARDFGGSLMGGLSYKLLRAGLRHLTFTG